MVSTLACSRMRWETLAAAMSRYPVPMDVVRAACSKDIEVGTRKVHFRSASGPSLIELELVPGKVMFTLLQVRNRIPQLPDLKA